MRREEIRQAFLVKWCDDLLARSSELSRRSIELEQRSAALLARSAEVVARAMRIVRTTEAGQLTPLGRGLGSGGR